jgi:hypothetical protein
MNFNLTEHALFRYITRFRPDLLKQVVDDIQNIVDAGTLVKRKGRPPKNCKYLQSGKKIIVITRDRTVKTVLQNSRNWRKIDNYGT